MSDVTPEVRIIKRYANRKLYDTLNSRYVTLDQIAEMIRDGDEVKIIDNKSKEDLTTVTLAQIIFEEEKKQRSFLPLQAMRNIIQNGGDSISQFAREAQKRVTNIIPRKEGEEGDGEDAEAVVEEAEVVSDDGAADDKPKDRPFRDLKEWVANSQRTIDDWQQKFDDRLKNVRDRVGGMPPIQAIQKDLATLGTRIAELEAKLKRANAEQPANEAPADGDDAGGVSD